MSNILNRMRLERRITLVILLLFVALATVYSIFFVDLAFFPSSDAAMVQPVSASSTQP